MGVQQRERQRDSAALGLNVVMDHRCPVRFFFFLNTLGTHIRGSHNLALLCFHAILWLILNINMSKLLGKRGIDKIAFLERDPFFLPYNRKIPISKSAGWASACICVSIDFKHEVIPQK